MYFSYVRKVRKERSGLCPDNPTDGKVVAQLYRFYLSFRVSVSAQKKGGVSRPFLLHKLPRAVSAAAAAAVIVVVAAAAAKDYDENDYPKTTVVSTASSEHKRCTSFRQPRFQQFKYTSGFRRRSAAGRSVVPLRTAQAFIQSPCLRRKRIRGFLRPYTPPEKIQTVSAWRGDGRPILSGVLTRLR